MNIQFTVKNEQILLRADSLNYELCRSRTRKDEETGESVEEWTPVLFFASLSQCLNKLIDLKVRASDATTLKELANDVEAARAEIMAAWSTAVPSHGECHK